MICGVGDRRYRGRAVDVSVAVDPGVLAQAVRFDGPVSGDPRVAVRTRGEPGRVHDHVGCIRPDMGLRVKTALARAGRSLGMSTPVDARIGELRRRLAEHDATVAGDAQDEFDTDDSESEVPSLRESVAAARGRLNALREVDADTEAAEASLESAVADLAAAETAVAATRQRRDRQRASRIERRDRLEERFGLEDALANRQREARAHLVDALRNQYIEALGEVPGDSDRPEPFEAPPERAALAIARIASLSAPIVLAGGRFDTAAEAAAWLEAPVLRVRS